MKIAPDPIGSGPRVAAEDLQPQPPSLPSPPPPPPVTPLSIRPGPAPASSPPPPAPPSGGFGTTPESGGKLGMHELKKQRSVALQNKTTLSQKLPS
jgi:hypothetical protein